MNSGKIIVDQNKKYLESNNVTVYVEEMMSGIIKEKPEEPLIFMMKFIQKKASQKGLRLPLEIGSKDNDSSINDGLRTLEFSRRQSGVSKSYEKPWLSGTGKAEYVTNTNTPVSNGNTSTANMAPSQQLYNNVSIDNEFKLVSESDNNTNITTSTAPSVSKSKSIRNSSKTKENLLQLINEERQNKINEKLIMEAKVKEKEDLNQEYDSAIELAEDPGLYSNEFTINNTNSLPIKSQSGVLIMKQSPSVNNCTDNMSVKFGICTNCSKFYQDNNESGRYPSEQYWPAAKGSFIMDDLESASQVNGPRMIDDEIELSRSRPKYNKKKISVSDFETTSRAWPVIDTASESSNNRELLPRTRLSSRNIPR